MRKRGSKLERLLNREINNKDLTEIHDFIEDLKAFDYSIIKTIREVCKKLRIGLFEAQSIVLNSPAWIGEKQSFIDFNSKVWEVLEEDADKVVDNENGAVSVTYNLQKDDEKK